MSATPNRLPTQPLKDVYVAGPFFNSVQIEIIERIESILTLKGFSYYSPRLDSGSHLLTPEQKKVSSNWNPIFQSNIEALHRCNIGIFCLGYPHPYPLSLRLVSHGRPRDRFDSGINLGREVELPDSGTVFEIGYMCALKKPRIGFHPNATPDKLNLMLTHGLNGIVLGWEQLDKFLTTPEENQDFFQPRLVVSWTACEQFDKEVE